MSSGSDQNDSSDGEDDFSLPFLFKSALDVGSHYIDIIPDNELLFVNHQGTLFTQLTIKNVTSRAHVAYFVRSRPLFYFWELGLHLGTPPHHHHAEAGIHPSELPASH